MAPLKFWVWFSALDAVGPRKRAALLRHFGTLENLYYAESGDYTAVPGITENDARDLSKKSFDAAERIIERCETEGIRILTRQDAEYPDRLKNIEAPPAALYILGTLPLVDEEVAITVVGSRRHTAYGGLVAERFGQELARGGAVLVSGMAKGIDSLAQRGALKAKGRTVAVLGGGVDVVYPAENRGLYEEILQNGAALSEYTPGTRPLGGNFPARNRIMSGLSLGTVVIEAPIHSGALITANYALEQGRDVFAVPGNIDIPENAGANELIKEGASLVTEAADILAEYVHLYPHKIRLTYAQRVEGQSRQARAEEKKVASPRAAYRAAGADGQAKKAEEPPKKLTEDDLKGFTDDERKIIVALAEGETHIDTIVERSGLAAADALASLTILELAGAVRQLPGSIFAIADQPRG